MFLIALREHLAGLLCPSHFLRQVRRELVEGWRRPQCGAIVGRGRAGIARVLEAVALHDQGAQVAGVQHQDAVDRRCHSRPVVQRAAGVRQADKDRHVGLPGLRGPQEQVAGGAGIATP